MAEDSDLERSEPATGRKIQQAREQGQIPRSQELSTFIVLMTGVLMLIFTGDSLMQALSSLMSDGLTFKAADLLTPDQQIRRLFSLSYAILLAFLPLLLAVSVLAILSHVLMGGWLFTTTLLAPNFARLNPLPGLKRIVSTHGLIEMLKAVLKASLIGGIAALILWRQRGELLGLIAEPQIEGIMHLGAIVRHTLLWVTASLLLIVMIDVPWQLFSYYKNLRMTKEEVRQEMKEAEGDPQIKARIRQVQRETARRRMMQAVPKADVIVTNPTHYAVALQYDQATMRAPKVVAKGAFKVAEQIIDLGRQNNIAILRTPPFARALYFHAPLDKEIPVALFQATAEVLAYIFQLRVYEASGGVRPAAPEDLPVPPELDPGEAAEDIPELPDPYAMARR